MSGGIHAPLLLHEDETWPTGTPTLVVNSDIIKNCCHPFFDDVIKF